MEPKITEKMWCKRSIVLSEFTGFKNRIYRINCNPSEYYAIHKILNRF